MTILKAKTEKTSTPVPILISEASLVYAWCQNDKCDLIAAGLNGGIIDTLPLLCDNCESLSVQCKIEKISLSRFRKIMQQEFKAASRTRSKIAEKIRYALYIAESNQKIPVYHRRRVNSEIIEDLINLEALCRYFSDILARTGFDQALSESLKPLALQLQDKHVEYYRLILDYKDLRKRFFSAYHELYASSQIIRKCAFEVFPMGTARRLGYQSQYRLDRS